MNDFSTPFQAPWWLSNPHEQTMWPTFIRSHIEITEKWERVELPDGDFLDLTWEATTVNQLDNPIVVLLHGLGGSIQSVYIRGIMNALVKNGFRPVLMHFRGASGVPNRMPQSYHSGETGDIAYIISKLKRENPGVPIYAIGYSLGANVILKWLGETGNGNPLTAAVAVSPPFQLSAIANRLMKGFSRCYQWYLLRGLIKEKKNKFKDRPCPFDLSQLDKVTNFWEFDDLVTAPLNGFKNVHDYYQRASCRQFLPKIAIPTLIIHASDDPFMSPDIIPELSELGKKTVFSLSKTGGHVGFVGGASPLSPDYWLEKIIPIFLRKNQV